ncbi:uncharacterized protein LOC132708769 [Cylas formicarius]|uniref:uncharacterized protein LOC132708769 n=1 Tax=Cylas formicarius TaxID=197179 RepID=UPI002958CDE4|nr:uncharacterized protein LOC132708769 [Cylas formicarius]
MEKLTTDSVPCPPREENIGMKTQIPNEKQETKYEFNEETIDPKRISAGGGITIINCTGIDIGTKCTVNIHNGNPQSKTPTVLLTPKIKNMFKSRQVISKEDIKYLSGVIGDFEQAARELDYEEGQIQQLKIDNPKIKEAIYQFLLDFKQTRNSEATVGAMAMALWKGDQKPAVKSWSSKIYEKHAQFL